MANVCYCKEDFFEFEKGKSYSYFSLPMGSIGEQYFVRVDDAKSHIPSFTREEFYRSFCMLDEHRNNIIDDII